MEGIKMQIDDSLMPFLPLIVTIALTFLGFLITYVNNLRLTRRKERLEIVNAQLNELYGPLYVITQASGISFRALQAKAISQGKKFVNEDAPLSKDDISEWRIWVEKVFIPSNEKLEKVITEKAHLVLEKDIPDCLMYFIAHSAGYKVVAEKWRLDDFSEALSIIPYPVDVVEYSKNSFQDLKRLQLKMIGHIS